MALERDSILNNRYRILDILGQGGMASIYRAVDQNLGVEVAVKENLFTTAEYARQFRLEAEILASLRHANLPRVTDHFVIEGQGQYLVMDYIEGEDLRQRIDRSGVLSDEEAIVVGVSICEALTYLHTRKPTVLHRDIKPGNVKITPTGQVFLVDFGLAKVVLGRSVTEEGARAMTPGYSPPEQYGTAHTDQRSDVYSLGATLYSALSDCLPEDGLARAMGQANLTSLRKYNPRVSRRMEQVLEKALAVQPEERYPDAETFRRDLLNSRATSRKKDPLDLTLSPPPEHFELDALEEAEMEESALASNSNGGFPMPVSKPISNPVRQSDKPRRKARRNRRGTSAWIGLLLFALIAFVTAGVLIYAPDLPASLAAGWLGPPQNPVEPTSQATSTSGAAVLPITDPAKETPSGTSETIVEATATRAVLVNAQSTPGVTPTPMGGGSALLAFASDRTGIPQIFIQNMAGQGVRQVTEIPEGACQPSWSPDGTQLVFISPCKKEQESYSNSSLFIINADGTDLTLLSDMPVGDYDPAWSPDGSKIAFTSLRDDRRPKIYTIDLLTMNLTLVASEGSINMHPSWSPDGKQIVFVTTRKGPYQIWIMDADGSNPARISSSGDLINTRPVMSPEGKIIVFVQVQTEGAIPGLYYAQVGAELMGGVRLYQNSVMPMRDPAFTSDGRWVLFETWEGGDDHNIAMVSSSGIDYRPLIEDPSYDFDPALQP